jgi:DNA-binding LacI/PurR family transcriptional regulator
LVHVTHQSSEKELRIVDYFRQMPMAAVIAAPNVESAHCYQTLACPVVFFDTIMEDLQTPQVVTDDTRGARRATEHLIDLGHVRIAHIGGIGDPTSLLRLNGYLDALGARGIPVDARLIKRRDYGREWGYYATSELFAKGKSRPTALVCGNDTLAAGALRCLRELGVACPVEVSVMGFGNTEIASALDLTTVDQPRQAIVDALLHNLRLLMHGEAPKPLTRIATELILRGSTAKAFCRPD